MPSWWFLRAKPSEEPTPDDGYDAFFSGDGTEGTTAGTLYRKDFNGVVTPVGAGGGGGGGTYTDEQAQDAVGRILFDTPTVDVTYNDAANTITAAVVAGSIGTTQLATNAVTNAVLADMPGATVKGRPAGAAGDPQDLNATALKALMSFASTDIGDFTEAAQDATGAALTDTASVHLAYNDAAGTITGQVQTNGIATAMIAANAVTATQIAAGAVTNVKLDNMPAKTFKANKTAGTSGAADVTVPEAKAMLAYAASDITSTPFGTITATTVQAQLQALYSLIQGSGGGGGGGAFSAYVTGFGDNIVTPLDLVTGAPGSPIAVGTEPIGIAITPDGTTAYVCNYGSNTVSPIALATSSVGTPIAVGTHPWAIAITPDGTKAYVCNSGVGTVTPITTATNTAGTAITFGGGFESSIAIAITPDGTTAYVVGDTSAPGANRGAVVPINLSTNTPGTPITVGYSTSGIAITPDGTKAYVCTPAAGASPGAVVPINIATNIAGTPIAVGIAPAAIAITPDGTRAYVADAFGKVTPINLATNTAGTAITVSVDSLSGIAITPDGTKAYVTSDEVVYPIDVSTNVVGAPIPAAAATGIAITTRSSTATETVKPNGLSSGVQHDYTVIGTTNSYDALADNSFSTYVHNSSNTPYFLSLAFTDLVGAAGRNIASFRVITFLTPDNPSMQVVPDLATVQGSRTFFGTHAEYVSADFTKFGGGTWTAAQINGMGIGINLTPNAASSSLFYFYVQVTYA